VLRVQLAPGNDTQSLAKHAGFDWKVTPRLYKAIKKIDLDVIHNHLGNFKYLMPSFPFLNMPIVYTVHFIQ
jgi:hypothetical protein